MKRNNFYLQFHLWSFAFLSIGFCLNSELKAKVFDWEKWHTEVELTLKLDKKRSQHNWQKFQEMKLFYQKNKAAKVSPLLKNVLSVLEEDDHYEFNPSDLQTIKDWWIKIQINEKNSPILKDFDTAQRFIKNLKLILSLNIPSTDEDDSLTTLFLEQSFNYLPFEKHQLLSKIVQAKNRNPEVQAFSEDFLKNLLEYFLKMADLAGIKSKTTNEMLQLVEGNLASEERKVFWEYFFKNKQRPIDFQMAQILLKNSILEPSFFELAKQKIQNEDSLKLLEMICDPLSSDTHNEIWRLFELVSVPDLLNQEHLAKVRKMAKHAFNLFTTEEISKIGKLSEDDIAYAQSIFQELPEKKIRTASNLFLLNYLPQAKTSLQKDLVRHEIIQQESLNSNSLTESITPSFLPFAFHNLHNRQDFNLYHQIVQEFPHSPELAPSPAIEQLQDYIKMSAAFRVAPLKSASKIFALMQNSSDYTSLDVQQKLNLNEKIFSVISLIREKHPKINPYEKLLQILKIHGPMKFRDQSILSLLELNEEKVCTEANSIPFFQRIFKKNINGLCALEQRLGQLSQSENSSEKFSGLSNYGNTCFFNAALNILFTDNHLMELFDPNKNILKKDKKESWALFMARKSFQSVCFNLAKAVRREANVFGPDKYLPSFYFHFNLVQKLRTGHTGLEKGYKIPGYQHDSHDALHAMFEILRGSESHLAFTFHDVLVPGNSHERKVQEHQDNILTLLATKYDKFGKVLPIRSVQEAYDHISQAETIDEFKDEKTKEKIGATKSNFLFGPKAPPTLVVSLNRNYYDPQTNHNRKYGDSVSNQYLNLPYFDEKGTKIGTHHYVMSGAVLHSGSVNSGHYYMINTQNPQRHVMHNDSSVHVMNQDGSSSINTGGVIFRYRLLTE